MPRIDDDQTPDTIPLYPYIILHNPTPGALCKISEPVSVAFGWSKTRSYMLVVVNVRQRVLAVLGDHLLAVGVGSPEYSSLPRRDKYDLEQLCDLA